MQYGMLIEVDKCIGCKACVVACKERWDTGQGGARDWVKEFSTTKSDNTPGLLFYPGLCNHCQDHPCTKDCPTGATYKNDQGVVVVDPNVCIGCGNCIPACPYGARFADDKKQVVEKCNFCEPYVKRGDQPACVKTCLGECRHFGDISSPNSTISALIDKRQAKPLTIATNPIGPHVFYAPAEASSAILSQAGTITTISSTPLTRMWQTYTRPVARYLIPTAFTMTALSGMALNFLNRRKRKVATLGDSVVKQANETLAASGPHRASEDPLEDTLIERHPFGLRALHWFNMVSWIILLISGTALMSSEKFALFGTKVAAFITSLVGSSSVLIKFHIVYGLLWAAIILPLFLYFKDWGRHAWDEIKITSDDIKWLFVKPKVLMGISPKSALPPQDKYNAGQKLFAWLVLMATTIIIVTGIIMSFHIGSASLVRSAILLHKLAIMAVLLGLGIHITMAAILFEERPALKSMVTGKISRSHVEKHNKKWISKIEE